MKKLVCGILAVAIFFTLNISVCAYTVNKDDSEIGSEDIFSKGSVYFEDTSVKNGKNVTVDLMIFGNEGFTQAEIALTLPEGIEIKTVENGTLGTASYEDGIITVESASAIEEDGCIAKITFDVSSEGEKSVQISVTAKNSDETIRISGSECIVKVLAGVKGDVNDDGQVDPVDLATLKLFLVGIKTNDAVNCDIDGDGSTDTSDLAVLKLILAGVYR